MQRCGRVGRALKQINSGRSQSLCSAFVPCQRFQEGIPGADSSDKGEARQGFAAVASNRLPDETADATAAEDQDDAVSDSENDAPPAVSVPFFQLDLGEGLQATAASAAGSSGQPTQFEVGRLARLATGACSVTRGGTQVLAAITCSQRQGYRREEGLSLQVEYRERLFASGRMPKNAMHTEGAPAVEEVLASSSVKAALRSLFNPTLPFELQVSLSVMSVDGEHDPVVAAINAASAALLVSPVPGVVPIAAVRVTVRSDGKVQVDAPLQGDSSAPPRLRLLLAGSRSGIVMMESEGLEGSPEDFAAALMAAQPAVLSLIAAQEKLAADTQVMKEDPLQDIADPSALATIAKHAQQAVLDAVWSREGGKRGRALRLHHVREQLTEQLHKTGAWRFGHSRLRGSGCVSPSDLEAGILALVNGAVRGLAMNSNLRSDGRGLTDLQPVHCQVGPQTAVHRAALYQGGETQVAAAVTITNTDARDVRSNGEKPLFVHYTLPSFAASDMPRRFGGAATAQEVAHSEMVRQALLPSMPPPSDDFPWTVRINADTLASNGSSAMAAVCAASLALDATGLPTKQLTAGVSVGMISRPGAPRSSFPPAAAPSAGGQAGSKPPQGQLSWVDEHDDQVSPSSVPIGHELLIDIQGLEQQAGEMELSVAGTRGGITAVRLEVARHGATVGAIVAGVRAAQSAHIPILSAMEKASAAAREGTPRRLGHVTIEPNLIGRFIGPGGVTIKAAEVETGAHFAVNDSGRVMVYAPRGNLTDALEAVQTSIGGNVKAGQQYTAQVVRLMDYGAFVELAGSGGTQALLHISEMSNERIRSVEDAVSVGQKIQVMCVGRDVRGNIKLSAKALLQDD